MRTLIVEDDFTSRILLQSILSRYGECHVAVNGAEAVRAFRLAVELERRYDLICLDIMLPEMDGQAVLKTIRKLEEEGGTSWDDHVNIVMTTALDGVKDAMSAFYGLCDAYLTKPIDATALYDHVKAMGFT
jgi:two-component system chemotaxis response regulator CheY